jgi:enediyne biosynthesis protein E4
VGEGTNFVQLTLTGGEGANRAAIGARVDLVAGDLRQTQEVGGGGGQLGDQTDLTLHFGLGAACEAEVTVRWPDAAGTTERFTLGSGYRWQIAQGAAQSSSGQGDTGRR